MRKLLALLFFMQSWMFAQSRFDGTWEMKMDTLQFSGPPEDYLFADGMYHCKSCIPKVDVKTDGVDHDVTGYSYDTLAVQILDDHAIRAGTLQIFQSAAGVMKISVGSASYEVRLEGADYPQSGDVHSTRSMKPIDEYTLEETDKIDGKVSGLTRWAISKDGKSMRVEFSSTKRGQTMKYTAEKQP
jgi:hypothetical protein